MTLDGFSGRPLGIVWPSDVSWRGERATAVKVGRRITGEVTDIDLDKGRARLSMTATEDPELWAFLRSRHRGEILSGTVAAIERFGVFVSLDDGPAHPVLPGVGFITVPELSWHHVDSVSDVVQVGQHVTCEFLQFDDWNGEARLSLRALRPDPFAAFAEGTRVGRILPVQVTRLVPFGAFVRVADGIEGLVHVRELARTPVETPEEVVRVGDDVTVVITGIDVQRRRLTLSLRQTSPDLP
ncbi:S1 RNA-binding domain-containing protein [Streptomyces sp. NPDC091371]|uniref:S1 RNA-binding domain-containing protein n=1 Tax=Streptomyces sp. NPDC091371 TaxID=3155303 RepID=UPI00343EB36B